MSRTRDDLDRPVLFIDNDGTLTDADALGPLYGTRYGQLLATRFGGTVEAWAEANAQAFATMMDWYHANMDRHVDATYFEHLYRLEFEEAFRHMGIPPPLWEGEGRLLSRRLLFECPAGVDTLFPGAREAVMELASRGHRLNMASNAHSLHCEGTLAGARIRQYFVHPFGPDLVDLPGKSVEFYQRLCAYAGVRPEQAIVVDDSLEPLAMAAEAGTRTVFVDQGHSTDRPAFTPDASIDQVARLPEAIAQVCTAG